MRQLAGDRFEVFSAGSHPAWYVHPLAIVVMAEEDIDISGHVSKSIDEYTGRQFDYAVTVCDHAQAHCPALAGRIATFHWPFEDPAMMMGDEEAALEKARCVRNEIRAKLVSFLEEHPVASEGNS